MIALSIPVGVDYDAAIEAVDESLTNFARGWRQPSMFRSSTFPLLLTLAKSLERPQTRIGRMVSNEFDTGDPNFVERDVGRYERVTPESIMQTARKFLPLDRRLVTIVRPVRGAPPGGRIAGRP
jgi:predicted Zn-dependent peptidase